MRGRDDVHKTLCCKGVEFGIPFIRNTDGILESGFSYCSKKTCSPFGGTFSKGPVHTQCGARIMGNLGYGSLYQHLSRQDIYTPEYVLNDLVIRRDGLNDEGISYLVRGNTYLLRQGSGSFTFFFCDSSHLPGRLLGLCSSLFRLFFFHARRGKGIAGNSGGAPGLSRLIRG